MAYAYQRQASLQPQQPTFHEVIQQQLEVQQQEIQQYQVEHTLVHLKYIYSRLKSYTVLFIDQSDARFGAVYSSIDRRCLRYVLKFMVKALIEQRQKRQTTVPVYYSFHASQLNAIHQK